MRTTIGVDGIDALIEGGVPRGASVLVAGEAGSGKSVLCLQFILAGIREGEPGVVLTTDEPGRVLETAAALGWDLRAAVDDGYARVVQIPRGARPLPEAEAVAAGAGTGPGDGPPGPGGPGGGRPGGGGGRGPGGPGGPGGGPGGMPFGGEPDAEAAAPPAHTGPAAAAIVAVTEAVAELQAERVAVDPAALPGTAPEASAAFVADLLRGVLAETHCTTLLTGQRLHGAAGYTRLGIEEQLVDGIIDLRVQEHAGRRSRVLAVRAMHGTSTDLDDHAFAIMPGRGIVVGET